MKPVWREWALVLAICVTVSLNPGCRGRADVANYAADQRGHRLVRISFSGQEGSFRIRVNEGPVERVRNTSFTNIMTKLDFEYGDIVVWEAVRDPRGKELTWPRDLDLWWITHLDRVRASYYCINSDNIKTIFSSPIYHWKAVAARPRPLKDATFYRNGVSIGQGFSGLCSMLDAVQDNRKSDIPFMLAPRIKHAPWEGTTDQVWTWMDEAGVAAKYPAHGWPGELQDFASINDDP